VGTGYFNPIRKVRSRRKMGEGGFDSANNLIGSCTLATLRDLNGLVGRNKRRKKVRVRRAKSNRRCPTEPDREKQTEKRITNLSPRHHWLQLSLRSGEERANESTKVPRGRGEENKVVSQITPRSERRPLRKPSRC